MRLKQPLRIVHEDEAIWPKTGADPFCPKCGSGDLRATDRRPPIRCRGCGWRGWMGTPRSAREGVSEQ